MKLSQQDQRLLGELCRQNNVSLAKVRKLLEGKLLPGDLEWRESTNEYAW